MPVYNAEKYLSEAMQSVLSQTYHNFEFIIVNDGSTDNSLQILNNFSDKRIKVISHKKNLGIIKSLNKAIENSQGKYIARMDADDICFKKRFEKQIKFLEHNPNIDICGTWIRNFGTKNYVWQTPTKHEIIRARMLFESSLAHPSVMIRRAFLKQSKLMYEKEYVHAEDFAFWVKAGEKTQLSNYPEPLLRYRTHPGQTPIKYQLTQQHSSWKIRKYQLNKMGIKPNKKEQKLHQSLSRWSRDFHFFDFWSIGNWLRSLLIQNHKKKYYSQSRLVLVIGERWAGMLSLYYQKNIFILLFAILHIDLSLLSLYFLIMKVLKK